MNDKLEQIVKDFVERYMISSPECIYQRDSVIENAYELIEELVNEVGYYVNEEEVSEDWLEQLEWEKHRDETNFPWLHSDGDSYK